MSASSSIAPSPPLRLPGRRFDHVFFLGMIVLLTSTVAIGFAHTYYLAGVFAAPLRSRVLQIHGAVFSSWMILLLIQATLVSTHRVGMHRRLGLAGMPVAGLVVIFGILAAGDSLAHAGPQASSQILSFSITPFTDMLAFAILAALAFYFRSDSAAHKRLILLATISMMRAAIFRWPFAFVYHNQIRAILISYVFVLLLVAYDLWSTHKLHRATLWGMSLLVAIHVVRIPVGQTGAWHSFARWFGSLGI